MNHLENPADRVTVGERRAYRARRVDPPVQVEVLDLTDHPPWRAHIRWTDPVGDSALEVSDWVPTGRLKVRRIDMDELCHREDRWQVIHSQGERLDAAIVRAVATVVDLLIDDQLARVRNPYRAPYLQIVRPRRLASRLRWSPQRLRTNTGVLDSDDGSVIAPWPTAEAIAKRAAR